MLFFNANGSSLACSARSRAFVAAGMSGLSSSRCYGVFGSDS